MKIARVIPLPGFKLYIVNFMLTYVNDILVNFLFISVSYIMSISQWEVVARAVEGKIDLLYHNFRLNGNDKKTVRGDFFHEFAQGYNNGRRTLSPLSVCDGNIA